MLLLVLAFSCIVAAQQCPPGMVWQTCPRGRQCAKAGWCRPSSRPTANGSSGGALVTPLRPVGPRPALVPRPVGSWDSSRQTTRIIVKCPGNKKPSAYLFARCGMDSGDGDPDTFNSCDKKDFSEGITDDKYYSYIDRIQRSYSGDKSSECCWVHSSYDEIYRNTVACRPSVN